MGSQHSRCSHSRCRPRALHLEELEDRTLLSVFTVDRLSDLGEGKEKAGDLRYCVTQANLLPGDDMINFSVKGTITLTSALPDLSSNIDLQGPGAAGLTVRNYIFTVGSGATVILSGLTITRGWPGIANYGTLTVNNATVSGNNGGIWNYLGTLTLNNATVTGNAFGIGNDRGTATLNNSTISDNRDGGGISNYLGTLTLNNSTVSGNVGFEDDPAGIVNSGTLTLNHSTVSGNIGDGIANSGTATLNHSTVSGNIGTAAAGGIGNDGTLTLLNSTVSGNIGGYGGTVGGIANAGHSRDANPTIMLLNSTVSGNSNAYANRSAGGIVNYTGLAIGNATITLVNSTIANNTVSGGERTGSQIYSGGTGPGQAIVRFRNTIVSGSGARPNFFADVGGTFVTQGHNLSSDDSGNLNPNLGDLPSTDPLLGPLQDNGGPTWTHALLTGSPAIDAGDNTDVPPTDQRGRPRVVNGIIDIGAYERQRFEVRPVGVLAALAATPSPPVRPHQLATPNAAAGRTPRVSVPRPPSAGRLDQFFALTAEEGHRWALPMRWQQPPGWVDGVSEPWSFWAEPGM